MNEQIFKYLYSPPYFGGENKFKHIFSFTLGPSYIKHQTVKNELVIFSQDTISRISKSPNHLLEIADPFSWRVWLGGDNKVFYILITLGA